MCCSWKTRTIIGTVTTLRRYQRSAQKRFCFADSFLYRIWIWHRLDSGYGSEIARFRYTRGITEQSISVYHRIYHVQWCNLRISSIWSPKMRSISIASSFQCGRTRSSSSKLPCAPRDAWSRRSQDVVLMQLPEEVEKTASTLRDENGFDRPGQSDSATRTTSSHHTWMHPRLDAFKALALADQNAISKRHVNSADLGAGPALGQRDSILLWRPNGPRDFGLIHSAPVPQACGTFWGFYNIYSSVCTRSTSIWPSCGKKRS